MWWLLLFIVALAAGYWYLIRPHKYWLSKGVKQGNPTFILGESGGTILRKQTIPEMMEMVYNMFPNTRYSGFYQILVPTLILKDPDLIKQITVKDFDHFVNHRTFLPDDCDPLWCNNLFALRDQKWREMRTILSPAFTSSKMKYMFDLILQRGEKFVSHFLEKNENTITIEMKDNFTRFANDVIASTAFGLECDSLGERNNEFYLMGKDISDFGSIWKIMKLLGYLVVPLLYKVIKIPLFSREVSDFFHNLVKTNIESREKAGIVRPDLIHLLLEARKNGLKHEKSQIQDTGFATAEEYNIGKPVRTKMEITDQDITAQAMVFFLAGFDSVSALMCFMSYELGINPDVQKRLIEEVEETLKTCDGKLTYEALSGMKYMDMVVSETLRKWPVTAVADRVCTKPYTIEPKYPDEKPVHLEKGCVVWVPFYALHRDPKYYPEPDRFDPERFSEENKANIKPCTYLPFGSGPRNCIGSRFALLETKILFFYLLSHFEIIPVEKTQIPLKISKKSFNMMAEDGFWLGLKRRVK